MFLQGESRGSACRVRAPRCDLPAIRDHQGTTPAQTHSPLLLPTYVPLSIPGTGVNDAQLLPPTTPPHPCNSQHGLRAQRIAPQISREEGVPIMGTRSPKSKNISRGYCRGRTASLPQNIKDKQSKSSESPPGALRVEVARFCFQMVPHIQDCAYIWMHPTSGLSEGTLLVKF